MTLNLLKGKYSCYRRLNSATPNSEQIEVRNDKVRCMYRFNQSACLKEKGLCCVVAKQAYDSAIALTSPKCTIEKAC